MVACKIAESSNSSELLMINPISKFSNSVKSVISKIKIASNTSINS